MFTQKEKENESKAEYPAASGLPGVERGGGQYPPHRLAVFYTGLGAALLLAGLLFGRNYGKAAFAAAPVSQKLEQKGE